MNTKHQEYIDNAEYEDETEIDFKYTEAINHVEDFTGPAKRRESLMIF